MERIGQCHCGSFRVIATGEPDRFSCAIVRRASGAPVPLFISVRPIRKNGCGSMANGRSTSATPTAAIAFDFISARICGTTLYWEGDRNPAVCGVAVGAFDISAFPPPSDSIWEASMHSWLGLPPHSDHHQQNRPPITIQT
jgi:hypothetical protein